MKKYLVEKIISYSYHIEVEAENADEAYQLAKEASDSEWEDDGYDPNWGFCPYGTTKIKRPKLIKEAAT